LAIAASSGIRATAAALGSCKNSGVTCRLEAIQFVDTDNGFAVGGWTQGYTHETHASRCAHGRRQNMAKLTGADAPGLKHVRFFDTRQAGRSATPRRYIPPGLSLGGRRRTWSPVPKAPAILTG